MLSRIEKAALDGNLTTVICKDHANNTQVEVLCIKVEDGKKEFLRPVAKIFENSLEALTEISPPEMYRVTGRQ